MSEHHSKEQGISEDNTLFFVGIPRTGSQTFATMLDAGGSSKIYSGNHTLEDFCIMHGYEKVKKYRKIASVRNPYDRIYSCWAYASMPAGVSFVEFIGLLNSHAQSIKSLDNKPVVTSLGLIQSNFPFGDRPFHGLASMSNFVKHPTLEIDTIISIDNIESSLEKISKLLGRQVKNVHINKSQTLDGSDSMKSDPSFIKIVNEIYEKDFQEFGYQML